MHSYIQGEMQPLFEATFSNSPTILAKSAFLNDASCSGVRTMPTFEALAFGSFKKLCLNDPSDITFPTNRSISSLDAKKKTSLFPVGNSAIYLFRFSNLIIRFNLAYNKKSISAIIKYLEHIKTTGIIRE